MQLKCFQMPVKCNTRIVYYNVYYTLTKDDNFKIGTQIFTKYMYRYCT